VLTATDHIGPKPIILRALYRHISQPDQRCGSLIFRDVTISHVTRNYTVFQKSDAKIQITITAAYLIRIKYPLI